MIYSPDSPQVSLQLVNCPNMVFMSICINLYQSFLTSHYASDAVGSCRSSSTPASIFPFCESCADLKVTRFLLQVLESSYCTPSSRSPLFRVSVGPVSLGKFRPECSHTHMQYTQERQTHTLYVSLYNKVPHTGTDMINSRH